MLTMNLPANDEIARELAGYISSEVDRTNSLVSRFLDFARPLQLRRAPADFADVITAASRSVRRDAERLHVALEVRPTPSSITFPLDAELMERVAVNLVLNALQASQPGSTVTVAARTAANEAILEVSDHGVGIPPDRIESIFNPFFTTKPDGTGLGLAIVAKIVDEHGGKINVQSIPGEGAVFTVTLPMNEQA